MLESRSETPETLLGESLVDEKKSASSKQTRERKCQSCALDVIFEEVENAYLSTEERQSRL
jgi:hypothetical protein